MIFGIGPAAELRKHNIPVVCDLPGVGANVTDHLMAPMVFKSKMKSMQYLFSRMKSFPALIEWSRFGTGAMTTNEFKRNDATSGKASPDLEIPFAPMSFRTMERHKRQWIS
ncbi:hypothetical protein B0A55_10487 [Friedmanniomyces simplex]|uniref:Uncharacterized protein n=1 Tax=Friedmanniomyces simplex TaxID=329884 RepID=A0A4U0WPT9_9PEZI|nr:hypothetical protein B0A55_10487 [Friedmanniomyces simplex]